MERYFPYYQSKMQHMLSPVQTEALYTEISKRILHICTKKFRISQSTINKTTPFNTQDLLTDRILMFYENLPAFPWPQYGPGAIIKNYNLEFFRYEALLQLRNLGVHVDGTPRDAVGRWQIKFLIAYFAWKRSKYKEYADWYFSKYGSVLDDKTLRVHQHKLRYIERMVIRSGGCNTYPVAFIGTKTISLDAGSYDEHALVHQDGFEDLF